ncbi:hypothetical protein HDV04_003505 [Boothiomyces sp. JEL0838]|nr:hypothetical protein HDV04_003505 [Boothiomyces sp. JEL0838]
MTVIESGRVNTSIDSHLNLKDSETRNDLTILANEYYSKYPYTANLTGTLVSTGIVLKDPDDQKPKLFFIFDDLNIKVQGEYFLQCHLLNMKRYASRLNRSFSAKTIDTKPFKVDLRSHFVKSTVKTSLSQSLEAQLYRRKR